ncbi:hypothetical protein K4L44_14890 [Halosquirtibacter laminarini]|uniref:Uncharacterized protein n=1 Tax=Halosquirtibacter laminarini TaxID=3374600 RepID=A0AC61NMJ1_9BACT|nr:hypothetical protein K4L44_14890 [Prolixibacteraceae bacterium]
MKRLIYLAITLFMVGCSAPKQVVQQPTTPANGMTEVVSYCSGSKYQSSEGIFRASGDFTSKDRMYAETMALQSAQTNLASEIEVTVKKAMEAYMGVHSNADNEDVIRRTQDLVKNNINQTLRGVVTICKKTMMNNNTGKYTCYIAVELNGDNVLKELNKGLSSDDKMRMDYDYQKFRKQVSSEMSNNK